MAADGADDAEPRSASDCHQAGFDHLPPWSASDCHQAAPDQLPPLTAPADPLAGSGGSAVADRPVWPDDQLA